MLLSGAYAPSCAGDACVSSRRFNWLYVNRLALSKSLRSQKSAPEACAVAGLLCAEGPAQNPQHAQRRCLC
jgi:hypothetical protein